MGRREKDRIVYNPPVFTEFKPVGAAGRYLDRVTMTLDEYEALRLADHKGLPHSEAADEMEISRPTFTRLVEKARAKAADLIINGKILEIDGGNIHFRNNILKCLNCGHMFTISFNHSLHKCPECNSENLLNLAGGFGHGRCCAFRNQNRGGRNAGRR
ncbi:MAG: DUF134 domain-containing protein [Candidatus Kapaibacterium sp.]